MAKNVKTSPKKKSAGVTKRASTVRKTVAKRPAKKAVATNQKVDYYPNRMTLAVSVLAATLLVLISLIAVLGVQ